MVPIRSTRHHPLASSSQNMHFICYWPVESLTNEDVHHTIKLRRYSSILEVFQTPAAVTVSRSEH